MIKEVSHDDTTFGNDFDSRLGIIIDQLNTWAIKQQTAWYYAFISDGDCHQHMDKQVQPVAPECPNLFLKQYSRCTDAFLVSKQGARVLCDEIEQHKISFPIDFEMNSIFQKRDLPIVWVEPTLCTPNNKFKSSLKTI